MASVFRTWYVDAKTGQRKRRRKWSIKYKAADGRWKTVAGLRDKEATLSMARDLERRAELERVGELDRFELHRATELTEHVDAFRRHLSAKGDGDDHIERTIARILAAVAGCRFEKFGHVDASQVEEWLASRRRAGDFGKRTSNYYLTAIKGFCRWMVNHKRAASNPLSCLSTIAADEPLATERRAVNDAQFAAIIAAADDARDRRQLPGHDRAMLYMVAAFTGFRAAELASMSPANFLLDGSEPVAFVLAAYSKRRRKDSQPLRTDLVVLLREWLIGKAEAAPLWPGRWYRKAAHMLRTDLKAAGVPYSDSMGRVFDFHSFRHTYITNLHKGGTYGKVLQSLARHSTPSLTSRYTHVDLADIDAALQGLPALPGASSRSSDAKQA